MITMTGIVSPDSFLEGRLAYESNIPDREWGGGESLPFPFLLACWPGVIFVAFSRRAKANAMWARSARQPSLVVRVSCLPDAPRSLCACLRSPVNNVRSAGYLSFLFLVTPACHAGYIWSCSSENLNLLLKKVNLRLQELIHYPQE